MIKKISAVAAAAIIAATMSVSAFATGYQDAVDAAKSAGVPATNVQELDNFLQPNKDEFTSAQYDGMIKDMNAVRDKYIAPYCKGGDKQVVDKAPADLTEADKDTIGKQLTKEQREAFLDEVVEMGKKYNVTINIKQAADGVHYTVSAKMNKKDDSKGGTGIKDDEPVSPTGGSTESSNTAAVAAAAVTLALAGVGVAIVTKKNRA